MSTIQRLIRPTSDHFFLLGPRATGKTTWLNQSEKYRQAARIDLLDSATFRTYLGRPERLSDFVAANKHKKAIILDEIQRVPELLHVVHTLIEQNAGVQFILTGSSARKLKQTGVDLLAGRAIIRMMHPFMAAELQESFNLSKALLHGLVPLIWVSENPLEKLNSYLHLYVEQEIRSEGIIRNLDQFVRFLEAIAFSHGNLLNVTDISRDCEVKRTTVAGYIQILEDLLMACTIPVFSKRAKRLLVGHSKFYFFDCGVFRTLRLSGSMDRPQEIEGQALEGLVLQHLHAWIDYGGIEARIHFWRTRAGNEVDFIVYGKDCFVAIEVKNAQRVRSEDLTGLRSFKEDYPECSTLLLYRGAEAVVQRGVYCMPVEQFLRMLVPGKPLPLLCE